MTATLTVRVKNETRQDLAGIVDDLDEAKDSADGLGQSLAKSSREASTEMARLTQRQSEEIKVIHEQRASWSSLAATAVPAIGSITVASLKYATVLAEIAARQKLLNSLMSPLAGSQRTFNTAMEIGEKLAVRGAASLAGYGSAAASATSFAAGLTIGIKSIEAVLSRTGVKKNALGEIETNLDRARGAASNLKADIAALGSEGVASLKNLATETANWAYESSGLKAGWKEFDRQITERTDNWVINARALGGAIRGVSRDAIEAAQRIEAAQTAAKDDFDRVRETNDSLAAAAEKRAEANRIAGLVTTSAVDAEIQKLKERRGIAAANNQFDEAAATRYMSEVERLEARRTSIQRKREQEESTERQKRVDDEKKASDEITRQYNMAFEARNKAILKENADYEKAMDDEVRAVMEQAQEQQKIAGQLTAKLHQEHERRQQAYVAKWQATVDRIAAMLQGNGETGGGAIDKIRAGISRKDVANQVGQTRADAAESEFRASGEGKRREEALIARGVDRNQAERQVMAQQRALRQRAFSQGFADTMRGRNGDEAVNAQNQLIQATAQQAAASGELAPVVAQGLVKAAQQAIQATQEAQQAKAMAEQVIAALNANGQRTGAINGRNRR